jgi:hypothetical protein
MSSRILLWVALITMVCSFVPRVCNKVAHTLASEGFLCNPGDDKRWEVTPTCVADLVASESAVPLS